MTMFKAFIFRIIGLALAAIALVLAVISFDALGMLSVFAFASAVVALILLKLANGFNRNFLGNLAFLAAFAVMMFTLVALGVFVACGA